MADGLFGTNVAAPRLRQTALRPAGIPGSTFVAPERREVGTNLNRLASALGNLNGALSGFAQRQEAKAKDPNSDDNLLYKARLQQMGFDELRAEAEAGTATGNKIKQDALDVLIAARANEAFRNDWTAYYNTEFDQTTGDIGTEYETRRAEWASRLPSEIARGAFYQGTREHFAQWQAADTKAKVEYVQGEINTSILSQFRLANDDLAAKGADAPTRAKAIFEMSAQNRPFLGLNGQQQNATIFILAQEYALAGDKDMVEALLKGNRVGANGETIPPLITTATYALDGNKLIETATTAWQANVAEKSLPTYISDNELVRQGKFTPEIAAQRVAEGVYEPGPASTRVNQSEAARLSGIAASQAEQAKAAQRFESRQAERLAVVQTLGVMTQVNGIGQVKDIDVIAETGDGYRTVTKGKLVEQATSLFEESMAEHEERLVSEQGFSPEQAAAITLGQKVAFYGNNKLANNEWSTALNNIASQATTENLIERGNMSAEMLATANLYRELAAKNPAYLRTVLTDPDARKFLEAFDYSVTQRKLPTEQALFAAAGIVARPYSETAKSILKPTEVDNLTDKVLGDLGLPKDRGDNRIYVSKRAEAMSELGVPKNVIEQRIKKEIEDTSVAVNGVLVADHNDLPDDFPVLMELELQGVAEVIGSDFGLDNWEDLAVRPVSGQSKWAVFDKRTGLETGNFITPQSLGVQRQKQDREYRALMLEKEQADATRAKEAKDKYEARVEYDRAVIEKYRARPGMAYQGIADYLQWVLNDRLKSDAEIKAMTPAKRQQMVDDHLKKLQEDILKQTGSDPSGPGL